MLLVGSAGPSRAASELFIVAHQDDDLLFMNPEILSRIAAGDDVHVVYLTAGDDDVLSSYWMGREKGLLNAYTYMAVAAGKLSAQDTVLAIHPPDLHCAQFGSVLEHWSVAEDPPITTSGGGVFKYVRFRMIGLAGQEISLTFLRISQVPTSQSPLQNMWNDPALAKGTVDSTFGTCNPSQCGWTCLDRCTGPCLGCDGGACAPCTECGGSCSGQLNCALGASLPQPYSYRREDLIEVLAAIMARRAPGRIHLQDSTNLHAAHLGYAYCTQPVPNYGYDHASHVYSGFFAFAAHQRYPAAHSLVIYRGYNINIEDQNLSSAEADAKRRILSYYTIADLDGCSDAQQCGSPGSTYCDANYQTYWPQRRYAIPEVRAKRTFIGALASDPGSAGSRCLTHDDGVIQASECQLGSVLLAAPRLWSLETSGFLKNQGSCLAVGADGTSLSAAPCPPMPGPSTRWSLFTNGQLRGGTVGDCLEHDPVSGEVRLRPCANSANQKWTLRPGVVKAWSTGTDFSDSAVPIGPTDSKHRTFALADWSGDGRADACMRRADGVWCGANTGATAFASWVRTSQGLGPWSDPAWDPPPYGSTIVYGRPGGSGAVHVCGRGPAGLYCGAFDANGHSLWTGEFSDAGIWDAGPSYYGSMRLADVNGDGFDDACGRRDDGMVCTLRVGPGQFQAQASRWTEEFSNAAGWAEDQYGTTIQLGDINGDGKADVCGRGVLGLRCAVAGPAPGVFSDEHWWSYQRPIVSGNPPTVSYEGEFGNSTGWGSNPAYYRSIRLVDVNADGRADACGRGANGVVCGFSTGTAFTPMRPILDRFFTDALGWGSDPYGSSLSFGDLFGNGAVGVCGRGSSKVYCSSLLAPSP
jgi:hypothetical protein